MIEEEHEPHFRSRKRYKMFYDVLEREVRETGVEDDEKERTTTSENEKELARLI